MNRLIVALIGFIFVVSFSARIEAGDSVTLNSEKEELLKRVQEEHLLPVEAMSALRQIFIGSPFIGQGNPAITRHPVSSEECGKKLGEEKIDYRNESFEKICGGRYMAPLYDPDKEKPEEAKACIDRFEFPNIPCAYPVIWVKAKEAAEICEALGKRLCDAHEWEGACAGRLEEPDYRFDLGSVQAMRTAHNRKHGPSKSWSYGPVYRKGVCAASGTKSPKCSGGSWSNCGSNTFPAGYFPECKSSLDVYDLHGNAAEHMNLPLNPSQMSSRGSKTLGYTEMKGSWFIFDTYHAHEDWCRWRAPFWHGGRVMDEHSHANYHLGFRCCKTLEKKVAPSSSD